MESSALRIEDLPHYTYDDYSKWEGQWELINGIPFAMVPAPAINHQRLSSKIDRQLGELLEDCNRCEAICSVDWQISEDTVVCPDVLVVCSEDMDIGIIKLEKTPVVVFEILSPSTSRKDRVVKYRLYENAGVKYYCLIDPGSKSAEVFVLKNREEKYCSSEEFEDGKILFDLGPCRIRFDLGKIFN
jgi:Uma2 family endonuclease